MKTSTFQKYVGGILKIYEQCSKSTLEVVRNIIVLIDSSTVFHPRGHLPERIIKTVNDPTDFLEVVYTFSRRRGKETWPKRFEPLF